MVQTSWASEWQLRTLTRCGSSRTGTLRAMPSSSFPPTSGGHRESLGQFLAALHLGLSLSSGLELWYH